MSVEKKIKKDKELFLEVEVQIKGRSQKKTGILGGVGVRWGPSPGLLSETISTPATPLPVKMVVHHYSIL